MKNSAKKVNEHNYQPQQVPQALKVIIGQNHKPDQNQEERLSGLSNGLEPEIDLMTLVQLPTSRLMETVTFYTEVLGLSREHPERPVESNCFLQTQPRLGPGLHFLQTPISEFRHLHGIVNGKPEEYVAFYAKNVAQLYEKLIKAGAEVVVHPSQGYMSFFDPEGHLVGVYERTDAATNDRFESNITGYRHVQIYVADLEREAAFFENALGFKQALRDDTGTYMTVPTGEFNQPMIRLVRATTPAHLQPMHWTLGGRPKHALELHSKNIGVLKERVLENGGVVNEELEFTGCGGYLKFFTPEGHYLWVNQDRRYNRPEDVN